MRRVLVPLDGTTLAASILPDARRLAGPNGELILIRDTSGMSHQGFTYLSEEREAVNACREYLLSVADELAKDGARVQVQPMVIGNAALAIDEAVTIFKVDMIAAATHGRNLTQRLLWGSVAWNALAHSSVPVLLRHASADEAPVTPRLPERRRILVPLDGSELAERALPLAAQLAAEWNAVTELVEVISDPFVPASPFGPPPYPLSYNQEEVEEEARSRLRGFAADFRGEVFTRVMSGPTVPRLIAAVEQDQITDIVIASHGRTGLSRVIFGSVADALIHQLHLPIIVVPALACVPTERYEASTVEPAPDQLTPQPTLIGEPW